MLDTVILNIPVDKFEIIKPEMFIPNATDFMGSYSYGKAYNNPTREESKWNYFPRMTLYRRPFVLPSLKVEFSAPKILFQNNLDEVNEADFDSVVNFLREKMALRGVDISQENLKHAAVSAFHASKNIEMSGYTTATMAIKALSMLQLTKRLDLTKTDFRNGGQSLQYYSKSHSLVFYDKICDMGKDEKRSIDHDMKDVQKSLFCLIRKMRRSTDVEILKMEVRLSQKRKMNSVLEKLGFRKNPTFEDIFKKEVCQAVLLDYWNTYVWEKNIHLFQKDKSKRDELIEISDYISNHNGKPIQALALLAIKDFCKGEGAESFRQIMEDKFGKSSWVNMSRHLKDLNHLAARSSRSLPEDYIKDIEIALQKFNSFRKEQILTQDDY